jgi:pyridoxal biosynthesis lyase PdxS
MVISLQLARADAMLHAPTELLLAVAALLVLPVVMWATGGSPR